jgi:enoyl-CoA hydratase/carnithine racemase
VTTDSGTASPPILSIDGHRAEIRLNRPAQHNRLESGDLAALRDIIAGLDARRDIRVVALTGNGRTFCSGYNLGELGQAAGRPGGDGGFETMVDALERLRMPTIAALNGPVYGGGTDLALACDFRIGAEGCRMFMPAARIGLHFYGNGIRRYASRLGLGAAKRLFLTGATIETAEMLRIGFLDEVVAGEQLQPRAEALAATIAGLAPEAVAGMKRVLNDFARGEYDAAVAQEGHRASRRSDEMKEGMAALREKRPPRFS